MFRKASRCIRLLKHISVTHTYAKTLSNTSAQLRECEGVEAEFHKRAQAVFFCKFLTEAG